MPDSNKNNNGAAGPFLPEAFLSPETLPVAAFLDFCGLRSRRDGISGTDEAFCGPRPFPPLVPLVDVRSPGEYRQGHIPGAVSFPLFSDGERAEVGTLYRKAGRDEAFFHGLSLVGPKMEGFARRAVALAGPGREVAMYCSRGGMRSGSMAWLFGQAGLRVRVLEGGYKSFRRHVLAFFDRLADSKDCTLRVLGGRTGSGKTELLHIMASRGAQVIDLEGMAHHRGSAFGALPDQPQPSIEHFSNLLAVALSQCDPSRPVWVEDESENLGTVNQPGPFYQLLRSSPLAVLEVPREARLARVLGEYGAMPREFMAAAVDRIRKRLGGLAHRQAHEALAAGNLAALAGILLDYYDRAYDRQLHKREPVTVAHVRNVAEAADIFVRSAENRSYPDSPIIDICGKK